MTRTESTREPRAIAADWHGGQGSALYAFTSTGTITDGLTDEIRECIALATERDRPELAALLAHVTEEGYLAQAKYLGADAALAGASWLIMSQSDAESILDDIDPEVLDRYPGPNLSGEWADDLTPDSLTFDVTGLSLQADRDALADAIADAWEAGRDLVWADALQAVALRTLGEVSRAVLVERVAEDWVDELRKAAGL